MKFTDSQVMVLKHITCKGFGLLVVLFDNSRKLLFQSKTTIAYIGDSNKVKYVASVAYVGDTNKIKYVAFMAYVGDSNKV